MANVLVEFPDTIAADGVGYHAHACGAPTVDGRWQGWIEFVPLDGGPPIRSPCETTQSNRTDAVYWATGLTGVYLDGALQRALKPLVVADLETHAPIFDEPAPIAHAAMAAAPDVVLDPFAVYEKEGEAVLRQRLSALVARHLVNVVQHYELSDQPRALLNRLPASELIELIVAGVQSEENRMARHRSR